MLICSIIFILVLGGLFAVARNAYRKEQRKYKDEINTLKQKLANCQNKPQPKPEPQPTPADPCADKRDGKYNPAWDKQTCNAHGYFFCPIAKKCMPSSVNVNDCGKPPHLM